MNELLGVNKKRGQKKKKLLGGRDDRGCKDVCLVTILTHVCVVYIDWHLKESKKTIKKKKKKTDGSENCIKGEEEEGV